MTLSYRERFVRLTERLAQWQAVWRPLPFQQPRPEWEARWPELAARLRGLDATTTARLQAAPFSDSPLDAWLPVEALADLCALPRLAGAAAPLPEAWAAHVGGRKWRQIEAFTARVALRPGQPVVEWCAGKAHLARTLARRHDGAVTALEWQAALCAAGRSLAARQGVALTLAEQDVLAPEAGRWLDGSTQVVALHACGDLHGRLIEQVAERGGGLTLAPCCYQRTADREYRPLSRLGRQLMAAHALRLTREDLALAVQETVTASRGEQRRRAQANAWRLGFDALQREVRGEDAYLPVPSLPYGQLPATFAAFCHWAADQKGLRLPPHCAWARYEALGERRLAEVTRLELVRQLFRRPLEVWLALDRLLRLAEAGRDVELGTFCSRTLTPRNLLLRVTPSAANGK